MVQKAHGAPQRREGAGGGAACRAGEEGCRAARGPASSGQEIQVLTVVRDVKKKSVEEATSSIEGLQKSKASAEHRADYYAARKINSNETDHLNQLTKAHDLQQISQGINALASALYLIPDIEAGVPPRVVFGGNFLGNAQSAFASAMGYFSGQHFNKATRAEIMAQREHRQDDWNLQAQLAQKRSNSSTSKSWPPRFACRSARWISTTTKSRSLRPKRPKHS